MVIIIKDIHFSVIHLDINLLCRDLILFFYLTYYNEIWNSNHTSVVIVKMLAAV